jgi:hypothetical protein
MEALEDHLRRQIEHSRRFFWHRLRWRAVAGYLPRQTPFQLLDIGAGAGLLGVYLARDRPQATYRFIEPLASLKDHLEQEYGAPANAAGLQTFAEIDFLVLLDVLEHQADDRAFLADLVGRMAPGTLLLVTVPALDILWSQWDVALGHHRRYTKSSLRRILDGLPVHVSEMSYLFPEMVPVGLARRLLRRRAPANGGSESALFPDLPVPLNEGLYGLGRLSLRLRRVAPLGSSLFAVLARRPN